MTEPDTKLTSGTGASCKEIADALVAGFNAVADGAEDPSEQLWAKYWSPDVVSVEGTGDAFHGMEAMKAKCAAWESEHEVLRCTIPHTFVGATGFTVVYDMEIKFRKTGDTISMTEAGVYEVKDGKVVREEFMYGPMPGM